MVIGNIPPEGITVIKEKINKLNCPDIWVKPALKIEDSSKKYDYKLSIQQAETQVKFIPPQSNQFTFYELEYNLPLLGEFQLINSSIAVASAQILQTQGWKINPNIIQKGISKTCWLGRLQWIQWQGKQILIDGAHNCDAAKFLRQYLDQFNLPIIWVIGILATKDYQKILEIILKPQDQLYIVPIPNHDSIEPQYLKSLADKICPNLEKSVTYEDIFIALKEINYNHHEQSLIVICGSLYLISYFLQKPTINIFDF